MTRFLIALALVVTACAATEQTFASPKPRIDGDIHAVSAADIRTVLALMPAHFRERHFKPVPIGRIHIINHDTMEVPTGRTLLLTLGESRGTGASIMQTPREFMSQGP